MHYGRWWKSSLVHFLTRVQNDYGSTFRDSVERNLNSIHFREFAQTPSSFRLDALDAKKALRKLADYERECQDKAWDHLTEEMHSLAIHDPALRSRNSRQMEILKLFCSVAELYGQIYMVRDMTNRKGQQAPPMVYTQ